VSLSLFTLLQGDAIVATKYVKMASKGYYTLNDQLRASLVVDGLIMHILKNKLFFDKALLQC
jgi:hypothetical protein